MRGKRRRGTDAMHATKQESIEYSIWRQKAPAVEGAEHCFSAWLLKQDFAASRIRKYEDAQRCDEANIELGSSVLSEYTTSWSAPLAHTSLPPAGVNLV